MHPVVQGILAVAAIIFIAGAVMYANANSKSGCFLGYCGTVIKTPG